MLKVIKNVLLSVLYSIVALVLLFLASTAIVRAIRADEAFDKAQEAAYVQIGLKSEVDKVGRYVETWANETFVSKSAVLRTGLGAYWIYRNQCVKWHFSGNTVNLYTNKFEIVFPF